MSFRRRLNWRLSPGSGRHGPHDERHGVADVAQSVAEVFIGGRRGGTAGGKSRSDGEGRERQAAFAPSSGSQLIHSQFAVREFVGRQCIGTQFIGRGRARSGRGSGRRDRCERGGRSHRERP